MVLAVTGLPPEIAREVPPDQFANRVYIDLGDGQGNIWRTGVDILLHGLCRKFAPLQMETAIGSMIGPVAFRRRPGEPIDKAVARLDLLRHTAHLGQFNMGSPNLAWMLLNALSIPPTQWAQYLAQTDGNLPAKDPEFQRNDGTDPQTRSFI